MSAAHAVAIARSPLAVLGLLNPIIAWAAMGFSSASVVTNSLRRGAAARARGWGRRGELR